MTTTTTPPIAAVAAQPSDELLLAIANRLAPTTKKVVLRSAESEYGAGFPPKNVLMLQAWIAESLGEVPEAFRDKAELEFSTESWGDHSSNLCMEFYYVRPETEAEFAERVHKAAMAAVRAEAQERRQFERLQAKYGKS
jgi:hypothetical protein